MAIQIISRKDAISSGHVRYFTGRPCKRCHVCERYTGNRNCVMCEQERHKLDRKSHRPNPVFQRHLVEMMYAHVEHPRDGYQNTRLYQIGADVAAQLALAGLRL